MKRELSVFLAVVFLFSAVMCPAAGAIDIYKFKKERVDQKISGNQGYIMGNPPAAKDRTGLKRTLIGVDIELPSSLAGEGAAAGQDSGGAKASPEKAGSRNKAPDGPETVVIEQETQEEVWIK